MCADRRPLQTGRRCTWALLLARIYEVFPLVCPNGGGTMRIIAFITDGPTVRDILVHLGAGPHAARRPLPIPHWLPGCVGPTELGLDVGFRGGITGHTFSVRESREP